MALAARLQLKSSQQLNLTPSLQQSLKILQMPALELQALIVQECEKNPFLSLDSNDETTSEKSSDIFSLPTVGILHKRGARFSDGDEFAFEDSPQNATAYILQQISQLSFSPQEKKIALHLLLCLDERGWLDESLEKISYTAEAPQNIVFGVLKILQTLEPCGIFARSLAECFALQLSDRPHDLELVERLLPHLDKISKEKPAILAKQCGMSLSALQHALQQLRGLNAAPLKTWEQSKAQENWRLSPDLFAVVSHEGQVEIFYNSENFPKAALDRQYYREIKPQIKTEIDKQFVANNYQEATHLVRAVEQREETLLKIARGIAVSQRQFFTHGAKALNPLTMAQLAEIVSLHESTVSRAVQGKTLLTPFGLQELKSFFSSSVSTQDGEEGCSSATVKHWIKKLLQEESPAFPLSDDNLVSKLQEMNIRIARRTIAKYREALQIPPSHLRKRANALVASA